MLVLPDAQRRRLHGAAGDEVEPVDASRGGSVVLDQREGRGVRLRHGAGEMPGPQLHRPLLLHRVEIEHADVLRIGVGHQQHLLVGRKGDAVRPGAGPKARAELVVAAVVNQNFIRILADDVEAIPEIVGHHVGEHARYVRQWSRAGRHPGC